MRKLLMLLAIMASFSALAQENIRIHGVVERNISTVQGETLKKGTEVVFTQFFNLGAGEYAQAIVEVDGKPVGTYVNQLDRIVFNTTNGGVEEFWNVQLMNRGVTKDIFMNGIQMPLRAEVEEDALEYLNYIVKSNLIFNDSYLESYLHQLLYQVFPGNLPDGRPGILNIKVLRDISPNAFVFPNGLMMITTGMLSTIHSEEELLAIMAHEVTHFALDHGIDNIRKAILRKKRAEFWAAFATTLAAAVDVYASSNNEYYTPGAITYNTAILAYSVSKEITDRLGIEYSREQELIADQCAAELLDFIGKDRSALSSALEKLRNKNIEAGNMAASDASSTHPQISERIRKIGAVKAFTDTNYDRTISLVNTENALNEFYSKRLDAAFALAERNKMAGVATEEDYLIQSKVLIYKYDTPEKNQEALGLVQKAKALNVYPSIEIQKQEAIVYLRLNKKTEAKNSLDNYRKSVEAELNRLGDIHDVIIWRKANQYLRDEYEWTVKTMYKVSSIQ